VSVDNKHICVQTVAANTWKDVHEVAKSQPAQQCRQGQPETLDFTCQEKAIITQRLIEWHQNQPSSMITASIEFLVGRLSGITKDLQLTALISWPLSFKLLQLIGLMFT